MIKISIILPTYNVQQYLGACLESCLQQDLLPSEYEIIIVIDGATDRSLEIAQQYSREHSNIVIIEQDNKGQSAARNTGLRAARGKYVWFVDSDDLIATHCLKNIVTKMEADQLDSLYVNLCRVNETGILIQDKKDNKELGIVSGTDFFNARLPGCYFACLYIYSRNFLCENGLLFYEGIIHEDVEFNIRMHYYAKRMALINDGVYFYRQRPGSTMSGAKKTERLSCLLKVIVSLTDFCQFVMDNNRYKISLSRAIVQLCSKYLFNAISWKVNRAEVYKLQKILPFKLWAQIGLFDKIKLCCMKIAPYLYGLFIVKYVAVNKS